MKIIVHNKKALSMALAAALAIAPVNAFAASNDIRGHWAERTITQWQDKGLIGGYQDGTFKPDKPATRAEFARIMNQALGLNHKGNVSFSDVSSSDWFYNDVAIAMGEQYTAGYPDGTFKPNEIITRAQAAVFIAKALGASGGSLASFKDASSIPAWAQGAVGGIVEKGYMSGYPDGTFRPNAVLTRAEAVSTLNRIMGETPVKEETKPTEKDVVIDESGTKLKDKTIEGNLTISDKVGKGKVTLSNVEIKGDLIIQGGGENSIYLDNTTVEGKTVMDKKNVRLEVSGKTKLPNVEIKEACNLTTSNFSGEVKRISITSSVSDKITIGVAADKLYVESKADLYITRDIDQVAVDKNAAGTKIEVGSNSKVTTLTADGKISLNGKGKVSTLEANVDDITYASDITITKIETAKGVEKPSKTNKNGTGGSSSSDSSSTKRSRRVSSAKDLASAIADNSLSTIYVTGAISGNVTATRSGSRNFTIDFGTNDINGDLSITAPKVTSIDLNDSATGDAGAVVENLTINAPNAEVTNNVKVAGIIDIKAVKLGTLLVRDAAAGIKMSGKGKVNVASTLPTPPPVTVATAESVALAGKLGTVAVTTADARVTVETGATLPGMTVSKTGATITANAPIPQIQTSNSLTIAGSGTVAEVQVVGDNNVTITGSSATITSITNTGNGSVTPPSGSSVSKKAVAPTGLAGVAPTSTSNDDGKINHTTALMEYKLATAADTAYADCSADATVVSAPGTYVVRVKELKDADSVLASDTVQVVVPAYVAPTDAQKVATAKTAIQALNIAWDTDLATTITKANEAIGTVTLPAGVTAVAAEGTDANAGKVVVTITSGSETDATIVIAVSAPTDAQKVATAKTAIQALNIAWDTDLTTTITKANEAIETVTLPAGVTAVAAEGTDANAGKVVVTITSGSETDATIVIAVSAPTDAQKVATAKAAIAAADYTNLAVADTSDAAQKLAAVQAVVDAAKGTTTAVATADGANFSVAISSGAASDTVSITTATFVVSDAGKVAAAKAAIAAADYTNLAVADTSDAAQKLAAVQAVVDAAKGTTTAVTTADGANFSVAISSGAASDTVSITTATFVVSDAGKVAAAKAAIAAADYTNLAVADTSDAAQKLAAVQAVVDAAKGTTTAVATADGANFSVAISSGTESDTVSITTATFVSNNTTLTTNAPAVVTDITGNVLAVASGTYTQALVDALVAPTGGSFELQKDDNSAATLDTDTTLVDATMKVVVTAENGAKATYTITV